MNRVLDSFWRAAAYCLHPRVIWLSLLPLVVAAALSVLLGWLFWEPAVTGVRHARNWSPLETFLFGWLSSVGAGRMRDALAPLIVVALAVPLIVVALAAAGRDADDAGHREPRRARRFPALERQHGASFWQRGLVARLHLARAAGDRDQHSAVAGAAAGAGAAAADLGLAHLSRDELRRAGRTRGSATSAARCCGAIAGRCSAWASSPATSARRRR